MNGWSGSPAISATGRFVAFASSGTNLVAGVTGTQVYVRDRLLGSTVVASVSSAGIPANSAASSPFISADGHFVSFGSFADNLVPGDTNQSYDVFTHDLATGATTRDSAPSDGTQGDMGLHGDFSESRDGRWVAFAPRMTNGECNFGGFNILVHDRLNGRTTRAVSCARGGGFTISNDGALIAFISKPLLGAPSLFIHDLVTNQTVEAVHSEEFLEQGRQFSPDSRFLPYRGGFSHEVSVYDRLTGQSIAVANAGDSFAGPSGVSVGAIGGDVIAFLSSDALVAQDTNAGYDVYVATPPPGVPGNPPPGAPGHLTYTLTGSTLTLMWTAPTAGGPPTAYVIEAGTRSGGTDVANFSTGSTALTFSVTIRGRGIYYYVRVRAVNANGVSAPSDELVAFLTSPCAPGAPSGLIGSVVGSTVTLNWTGGEAAASYILGVFSASVGEDILVTDLNSSATTLTATGVAAGTYVVRVQSTNACGTSVISNQVVVTVR